MVYKPVFLQTADVVAHAQVAMLRGTSFLNQPGNKDFGNGDGSKRLLAVLEEARDRAAATRKGTMEQRVVLVYAVVGCWLRH